MSEVMVETLEGLGMLPMLKDFEDGPARPFQRVPIRMIGRQFPTNEHTPPRPLPLPLPTNTGIVPPNRRGIFGWLQDRAGSTMTPPKLLNLPGLPGNSGVVPPSGVSESGPTPTPMPLPPKASAIVTMASPTYSAQPPVDESTWTPPDDALIQDQFGLDQGVDSGLRDDLYASQDYQADGESSDGSLWGLGDVMDLIPDIMSQQPTAVPASSGGFLNSLGSFLNTALPTAAQVYASVQATKQGNPMLGAQVAQQGRPSGIPQGYPTTPGYTPGPMPGGYPGAPSWFSQRTILSSMSNGAVVGIAAAAAVALLVVLKKHRGA